MPDVCPECGAPIPDAGSCRDNFHALLLLESEIPGGPGEVPHFYAVGTYALQHPGSMGYTAEMLAGLRACVSDHLDGKATLDAVRRRVRRGSEGARRVTRRAGDEVVRWPVGAWPMTVADVCAGGSDGYTGHVEQWAPVRSGHARRYRRQAAGQPRLRTLAAATPAFPGGSPDPLFVTLVTGPIFRTPVVTGPYVNVSATVTR